VIPMRVRRFFVSLFLVLLVVGAAAPARAEGLNTLRPSTRAVERAITRQVQQRLFPELAVRNATGPARDLAVSPERTIMATVTGAGRLRLFDLASGQEVRVVEPPTGGGFAEVALGPGAEPILLRDDAGGVRMATGLSAPLARLEVPDASGVTAIAVDAEEARVALGHRDGGVTLWDAVRQRSVTAHDGPASPVRALVATRDGFVAGHDNGEVRALDASTARSVATIPDGIAVTALVALDDGGLAVGDARGRVHLIRDDGTSQRWQAHDGTVRSLATPGAGTLVSGGEAGAIRVWRTEDGSALRSLRGGGSAVRDLAVLAGGGAARVLATGAPNGGLLFDPAREAPLARLILVRDGWGVVDGDGRFDGTEAAFEDIAWQAKGDRMALDRFAARYFEPGLLVKHLRPGVPFLTRESEPIGQGIYAPPEVTLELDAPRREAGATVSVTATGATTAPASVEEVLLFHNGKQVAARHETDRDRGDDGGRRRLAVSYDVELLAGENDFRAVAVGWGQIWSEPAERTVSAEARRPETTALWLNAVGVNEYADPRFNLNYAVADAVSVAEVVGERAGPLFDEVKRSVLLDGEARRRAVLRELEEPAAGSAGDVAVVFLSGHARTVGTDWYFLPHELRDLRDAAHVRRVGIASDDLAEALVEIPAQRVLVIIDTCQAGAFIGDLDEFGQRRALRGLRQRTGVYVIAATRADQLAPEYRMLGHGLLTYVLLRGLAPGDAGGLEADRAPRDGTLTVSELQDYVEREVPLLAYELDNRLRSPAGGRGDYAQTVPVTPVGFALGEDFALARR